MDENLLNILWALKFSQQDLAVITFSYSNEEERSTQ